MKVSLGAERAGAAAAATAWRGRDHHLCLEQRRQGRQQQVSLSHEPWAGGDPCTLEDVYVGKIKEMTPPCLHPSPVRLDVPAYSVAGPRPASPLGSTVPVGAGRPALFGLLRGQQPDGQHLHLAEHEHQAFDRAQPGSTGCAGGGAAAAEERVHGAGARLGAGTVRAVQFDNYLQIVNPNDETATITWRSVLAAAGELMVDGVRRTAPCNSAQGPLVAAGEDRPARYAISAGRGTRRCVRLGECAGIAVRLGRRSQDADPRVQPVTVAGAVNRARRGRPGPRG